MKKKPTIALLIDTHNWAYDFSAKALTRRLSDRYNFHFYYASDEPKLDPKSFDLIYIFYWGDEHHKKFSIEPKKIIKEVASHRWQVEEKFGKLSTEQFVQRYLGECGTVTTPSLRLYNMLRPFLKDIFHCPNGVESEIFKYKRARSGPLHIGWVGNPRDSCKGLHDVLVPAIGDRFQFSYSPGTWSRKRVAKFYNQIDVIAIASTAEGQPLPLLEGMACGCFPVCTDVGIVPELINSGFNGLILERSAAEFRNAFLWCEQNLAMIRRVGSYNAATCKAMRLWDNLVSNFSKVFDLALGIEPKIHADNHKLFGPEPKPIADICQQTPPLDQKDYYTAGPKLVDINEAEQPKYLAYVELYETKLKPLLSPDRKSRILVIGPRFGYLIRYLLEKGYSHVGTIYDSIEFAEKYRHHFRNRLEFSLNTDPIQFLINSPCHFNLIIFNDVISYIPSDKRALTMQAICSALEPRGRVLFHNPHDANIFVEHGENSTANWQLNTIDSKFYALLQANGFKIPQIDMHESSRTSKEDLGKKRRNWFTGILFKERVRHNQNESKKYIIFWADKKVL